MWTVPSCPVAPPAAPCVRKAARGAVCVSGHQGRRTGCVSMPKAPKRTSERSPRCISYTAWKLALGPWLGAQGCPRAAGRVGYKCDSHCSDGTEDSGHRARSGRRGRAAPHCWPFEQVTQAAHPQAPRPGTDRGQRLGTPRDRPLLRAQVQAGCAARCHLNSDGLRTAGAAADRVTVARVLCGRAALPSPGPRLPREFRKDAPA